MKKFVINDQKHPRLNFFIDSKTPCKRYTHANFHDVTLADIIKAIPNQFDSGDTNNDPSNVVPTFKAISTDDSDNDAMILTNLSKREKVSPSDTRKVIYISNTSSKQKMR